MIIVRIVPGAGMGNQMFMYAAGLAAASRLNTELLLDNADFQYSDRDDRDYQLSFFPEITERSASFIDIWRMSPGTAVMNAISRRQIKKYHIFRRLVRKSIKIMHLAPIHNKYFTQIAQDGPFPYPYKSSPRLFMENNAHKNRFAEIPDNTYLRGHWESEDYFADYADLVRMKFTFAQECFDPKLTAEVRTCEAVAVHVRRGDKAEDNSFYGSNERYLRLAMEKISGLTFRPRFFVFSDDIEWCRETLPKIHDTDYTFIEGRTPPQDMALMTQCRHVIVGPSTFSWWGAWLNDNPNKIIIAPDINLWYKQLTPSVIEDRKYLLPREWIKIR